MARKEEATQSTEAERTLQRRPCPSYAEDEPAEHAPKVILGTKLLWVGCLEKI